MSDAPHTDIDPNAFAIDPYPILAHMRKNAPITFVPQLGATLFTRRDDIHKQEKRIETFSSDQPDGLMTVLMGQNMMRKDGADHMAERKALFPTVSPKTVASHWKPLFEQKTLQILERLKPKGKGDLMRDYAMPVSAEALKLITGLTDMTPDEMDGTSQAMIDGCANYAGNPEIEARCHAGTALIDAHIDKMWDSAAPYSALKVQRDAGVSEYSVRANIKLVISGGQNEPRDAIAGAIWALLTHPEQYALIQNGTVDWSAAFYEYARWQSPIGMSPRRVARADQVNGVTFEPEDRVFFMFGSANRDDAYFDTPDMFDLTRDTSAAIPFGAGPHFCAGAAASRCLITEVALPLAFEHLRNLRLTGDVPFYGWAFRGPTAVPATWDV